jgi:hypothetical protein
MVTGALIAAGDPDVWTDVVVVPAAITSLRAGALAEVKFTSPEYTALIP